MVNQDESLLFFKVHFFQASLWVANPRLPPRLVSLFAQNTPPLNPIGFWRWIPAFNGLRLPPPSAHGNWKSRESYGRERRTGTGEELWWTGTGQEPRWPRTGQEPRWSGAGHGHQSQWRNPLGTGGVRGEMGKWLATCKFPIFYSTKTLNFEAYLDVPGRKLVIQRLGWVVFSQGIPHL